MSSEMKEIALISQIILTGFFFTSVRSNLLSTVTRDNQLYNLTGFQYYKNSDE